jgi:hypothetical protein
MGSGIDASGHAADDIDLLPGQIHAELPRGGNAIGGGISGPHDGDVQPVAGSDP